MDGIHWENREISECPDSLAQAHIVVRQLGDCVEQAQEEELGNEREGRERREGRKRGGREGVYVNDFSSDIWKQTAQP